MAEIRHINADDLPGWLRTRRTVFLQDPVVSDQQVAWWASFMDPARTLGAFSDGHCVATLRTFPTTLTVPDGRQTREIPADALTNVTVAGTHRRQGLLRGMLSASLTHAKERGETVSILNSAEWPIYGRFGYWPSTWSANYRVRCDRQATLVNDGTDLTVRETSLDSAGDVGPVLYERMRGTQVGHIGRSRSQWQQRLGLDGAQRGYPREPVCVLAVNADNQPEGLVTWSANHADWHHEPVDVTVHDLIAASPAAYRVLWDYLIHLDLVAAIRFDDRAVDEPLQWLLSDGRLTQRVATEDALWLRILDVPTALSARRYAIDARLTVTVVDDDFGGWAAGTYRLDGGLSHADCILAPGSTADLTLSQRALAAVYLGGNTVGSQQLAGLVDEHTAGAVNTLAAMLHTERQPFNATGF